MAEPLGDAALDTLFRVARSQNGWTEDSIEESSIRAIWDLMRWGPTSANAEPARIVWCVSEEAKRRLARHCAEQNAPKILDAPATAIIGHDLEFYERLPELFPHVDAKPWFVGNDAHIRATAIRNGSLQGAYLMLAARALGLDVGPMSGFDIAAVDADFFAGTRIEANFICSIGRGDPAKVFPRLPRLAFEDANTIL